jgi:hypothetical protein
LKLKKRTLDERHNGRLGPDTSITTVTSAKYSRFNAPVNVELPPEAMSAPEASR